MPAGELDSETDLPPGWERSETFNRIPFYLDHNNGITQWDHPAVEKTFDEFESLSNIKYSAYRTAMKIRLIQAISNMHCIEVVDIIDACKTLSIDTNQTLSVTDVELLLTEIFSKRVKRERQQQKALQEKSDSKQRLQAAIEITLNILLKCIDSGRTGILNGASVLVVLLALSCGVPDSKYRAMFDIFASEDGHLLKKDLSLLLSSMLSITVCINENEHFGFKIVPAALNACIKSKEYLTKVEFLDWMSCDPVPQVAVWLPTVNRMAMAETVKHEAKCNICKSFPIVGLRFRCLKCLNTDICQNCFLTNNGNRTHKSTHPTKEYCCATTSTDDVKDFVKQLKNKITRRYRHAHLSRPSVLTDDGGNSSRPICTLQEVHDSLKTLACRLDELENDSEREYDGNEKSEASYHEPHSVGIQMTSTLPLSSYHFIQTPSTAEYLDKGISVSTLDDFALGGEAEQLNKLTKQMLDVFDGNYNLDPHNLLYLGSEVAKKTSKFCDSLKLDQ